MAITVADLKEHLGIPPASTQDEAAMQSAVDAANDKARELIPDLTETEPWPFRVDFGCRLLAARSYGRRGSVLGAAMFADVAVATLGRIDPDVAFYWGLGEHQQSVVA